MTEKRCTIHNGQIILDGFPLSNEKAAALINELLEEIRIFKIKDERKLFSRRELERENKGLKQENEALKKFVKVNFSDMMAEKMEKGVKRMDLDDFTCDEIKEYKVTDNNSEVIIPGNPLEEIIFSDKTLEEKLNEVGKLIIETKEDLNNCPKEIWPREHERYRLKLHSCELTASRLKEAMFEDMIKGL